MSGKKEDLYERILHHCRSFRPLPKYLTSIDLGISHLALATFKTTKKPEIIQWKLLKPDVPADYDVDGFAQGCHQLLKQFDFQDHLFLLERQSFRPLGFSRIIPITIIKHVAFEAHLYSQLFQKTTVHSIQPRAISKYFELSPEGYNYTMKKKLATDLVTNLIERKVECPPILLDNFQKAHKKDDLADCILLGLAYLEWHRNTSLLNLETMQFDGI